MLMILTGGWKAARDLGLPAQWRRTVRYVIPAYWSRVVGWWNRRIRGRVAGSAAPASIELKATAHGVGTVTGGPWEDLDTDARVERLKVVVEGLRDLVDRDREAAQARTDAVEQRLSELEVSVDERFEGHDTRDETILIWELAGGATSLLGTVLVFLA